MEERQLDCVERGYLLVPAALMAMGGLGQANPINIDCLSHQALRLGLTTKPARPRSSIMPFSLYRVGEGVIRPEAICRDETATIAVVPSRPQVLRRVAYGAASVPMRRWTGWVPSMAAWA